MTVRRMTLNDLHRVIDWAAAEGWNPGVDDAKAFYAADPQGFFVKEHAGQIAAAVSVVNHDDANAFLGLYICQPELRGQGHGIEVWRAAVAHAGDRCIGLDGVPDQQDNYVRAGFTKYGRTTRYQGVVPRGGKARPMQDEGLDQLMLADQRATGLNRINFAQTWLRGDTTRQTILLPDTAEPAFATFRQCREGVKIGPFHASSADQATQLLESCPPAWPTAPDSPVFIDVPDSSADLIALLSARGFVPVFETARMYTSPPPKVQEPVFYAVATLELG